MSNQQTYSFDEMAVLDSAVSALREVNLAVFTPKSLLEELTTWGPRLYPNGDAAFESGLAKLRNEDHSKLADWLAHKADWLCIAKDRFQFT